MKKCGKCKQLLPLELFYNAANSRDGKGYRCKPCDVVARKESRAKSPRTAEGYRRRALKLKYGFTPEFYNEILKAQGGCCRICKTTNPCGEGNINTKRTFSFAVDHDHETGQIRGLLCNTCNRGLGFFKDSVNLLKNAVSYLEAYSDSHK